MTESWIESEPGLERAAFELGCIARRARKRWLLTLSLALLVALFVGTTQARKAPLFESRVVLSVTETDMQTVVAPVMAGELRAYLREVILSNTALLGIMKDRNHLTSMMRLDPSRALIEMRDRIGLGVTDTFHTILGEQEVRTATVWVRYRDGDPDVALQIARDLGRLIVEGQAHARQAATQEALSVVSGAATRLQDDLSHARLEAARLRREYLASPPEARARLVGPLRAVLGSVDSIEQEMGFLQTDASRLELSKAPGAGSLEFRVLDPGQLAAPPRLSPPQQGVALGIFVFLLAIPLASIFVATVDWKVRDLETLSRLGVTAFAQMPSFENADFGSLRQRRARGGGQSE